MIWLLTGCGLKPLLPGKAVVTAKQLAAFAPAQPSGAVYEGGPLVGFPVIPLQAFGLQYAVDVVYVTQHAAWDMHEYARLDVPGESVWIAKDSDQQGRQTIVADRPQLHTWMPEIPAPRIEAPISLMDKSQGRDIDIELAYTNPAGEAVRVTAAGRMPKRPPAKRNGSTMGHSRDVVAAVLDLERFGSRISGQMTFDDERIRFKRILGLVPFRFLLKQTQAGLVVTNFRQTASESGFVLTRPSPTDPEWPTSAQEQWTHTDSAAQYDNGINRFDYRFVAGGLAQIEVTQHGVNKPTLQLKLQPALPDLRRPFEGTLNSQFVMDVNGQEGHGTGTVNASWVDEHSVRITVTPTAPWWLADRPMESIIRFTDEGEVDVRTRRVDHPHKEVSSTTAQQKKTPNHQGWASES